MTHPKVSKIWTMGKKFEGAPKLSDFQTRDEPLRELVDGEFLTEALVWSVDPYNRIIAGQGKAGDPMIGYQLGKVVESKSSQYPVGTVVLTTAGWRTHAVLNDSDEGSVVSGQAFKIPEDILKKHPATYFVGVLGMPGATAFFGVMEKLQPKAGETMVVNAASGAVGALVGQIGKFLSLRTIGYAGSDAKVAYLKEIGFDHAFNYKTQNLAQTLKLAAPNGVDVFFDSVAFDFGVTVIEHMNIGGRICQCGYIAGYNETKPKQVVFPYPDVIFKGITLYGFMVGFYLHRYQEFVSKMSSWVADGKVKVKETKYSGFDKMPQALIDNLSGAVEGKAVILP